MADFSSNITVALGNDTEVIGSAAPTDNVTVGAVKESGQTGLYINTNKAYTAWFKNADGTWTSVKAFSSDNFPTSFTFAWGDYTAFFMQTSEDSHVAYLYPRTGPLLVDGDLSDDTNTPDTLISGGDQIYTVLGSISGGAVGVLEDADASLQTRLSTEEAARSTGESSLTTRISTEEATRSTAVSSLVTRISTEEVNRSTADSSLAIVDTGLTNSVNSLSGRISAEELASSSLASRVSTEEATRSTADSTLTAAAGSLTTRISTEEAARSTADSTLTAAVSTEKSRVDAILDAADADKDSFAEIVSIINQVDTEQSTGIANIISNLNAEISATNTDVGSIDSRVSSEESVRASADASLATSISGEASSRASDVSSIDSAISAVQADVDQNEANAASDISDEQATRALAVSSLATRISTEEAARSTADSTLTAAAGSLTTRVSTEEAARATADSSLATAFASADTSLATSLATSLTTTAVTISGSSDIPFAIYNAGDTSPLFMVDSSSSWDGAPRVTIRQANDHGQEDTAYPATVNTDGAVRGVFHVEKEMSEGDYDSSTEENMPLISAFAIGDGSNAGSAATGGDAIVRLVSWGGDSKIQMYASADNYDATAIGGKRPLSGQTLGAIEMGGYATN